MIEIFENSRKFKKIPDFSENSRNFGKNSFSNGRKLKKKKS
jgi:hypothetical protein